MVQTVKNIQQGAASPSPAQLVHDFEGFPHVPRVKGDWTLSLRSVFLLQRMWTKSSAPEGGGGHQSKKKAGNNPYHQDNKQCAISHLYTSAVETRSLYKRRNKQCQLNSISHLYSFTFQAISYTHARLHMQLKPCHTHSLTGGACGVFNGPYCLFSPLLTLNFLFFSSFFFVQLLKDNRWNQAAG